MEMRQLEYFVAVAEERSFTRAAERVHISQSGVSAQIRRLERDLGAPLFDRSSRTATLTAAAALHPRIALQATAPDAVADLASRGMGVGILSASMAADPPDALHAIAIDDIPIPALLALVWPPASSAAALRVLLQFAAEAFGQAKT
jgi:DNA-binding transcriptional LysR family regulator